jgi:hypothetical protein
MNEFFWFFEKKSQKQNLALILFLALLFEKKSQILALFGSSFRKEEPNFSSFWHFSGILKRRQKKLESNFSSF